MPLIGNKTLTPAEALKKGLCPECADDLANQDATAHARRHWGEDLNRELRNTEATARRRMLLDYGKSKPAEKVES